MERRLLPTRAIFSFAEGPTEAEHRFKGASTGHGRLPQTDKDIMKVFAAVLAISIASIASTASSLAQTAPTIIQGTVNNPERNPIPDVSVYAYTQGGTFQTTTDRDGHFSFWNINSGDVVVTFSRSGYDSLSGALCLRPGALRNFHLTMVRSNGLLAYSYAFRTIARPDMVDTTGATTFENCQVMRGSFRPYAIGTMPL